MVQLDYAISKLNMLQRKWIYLEPIFARKALPQEEERFFMVDKEFRE
jgi:dynein heavy chain 2